MGDSDGQLQNRITPAVTETAMVEPQASDGAAEPAPGAAHGLQPGWWQFQGSALSNIPHLIPGSYISGGESSVLMAADGGIAWLGHEHRRLERYPVQASRPIGMRLIHQHGQPQQRWMLADILDISCGGLCVLLSGSLLLPVSLPVQLDVSCHPSFGRQRLDARVRWCRGSLSFTTLGLAFCETLLRVPHLEPERRTIRRDPNRETRAQA